MAYIKCDRFRTAIIYYVGNVIVRDFSGRAYISLSKCMLVRPNITVCMLIFCFVSSDFSIYTPNDVWRAQTSIIYTPFTGYRISEACRYLGVDPGDHIYGS